MERAPGTFTRDELDAAEPEALPSSRTRWAIGLGVGALGSLWIGLPFGLLALPWAFTPAGAGALLGTGIVFVVWSAISVAGLAGLGPDVVGDADLDAWSMALLVIGAIGGAVALVAGVAGSLRVAIRARAR